MVNAFGAAAAPMSFGEVYTAIQQGVIDGAENNELALTNNKHGEVAKYYSYNKHQMVPDMLVANLKFLNGLSRKNIRYLKRLLLFPLKLRWLSGTRALKRQRTLPLIRWAFSSLM